LLAPLCLAGHEGAREAACSSTRLCRTCACDRPGGEELAARLWMGLLL